MIDIAPTVLEAAGLPEPKTVNGVVQTPMEGVSMVYTFDDAKAAGPAQDAVLRDLRQPRPSTTTAGWPPPCTRPRGKRKPRRALAEDVWELYNVDEDFSETNDLAAKQSRQAQGAAGALHEGSRADTACCRSTTASLERFDPAMAGRPDLMAGRKSLTVYEGMTGMMENAFINVKNQSMTITADVEIPAGGANGVILCQGGRFGGWSLYVKDGKPAYTYNFVGLQQYTVNVAAKRLAPGKATIKLEFAYDGNGRGKGGTARSTSTARRSDQGRVERHQCQHLLRRRAADVGVDEGTNVSSAIQGTRQQVHRQDREGAGGASSSKPSRMSVIVALRPSPDRSMRQ